MSDVPDSGHEIEMPPPAEETLSIPGFRFSNLSFVPRNAWATLTVPREVSLPVMSDGTLLFEDENGARFYGIAERVLGEHSQVIHVHGRWQPQETLLTLKSSDESAAALADEERFYPSPWLPKDTEALLPSLEGVWGGRTYRINRKDWDVVRLRGNSAYETFRLRAVFPTEDVQPGTPHLWAEMFIRVPSLEEVLEFELHVGFSDPTTPQMEVKIDRLSFETEEWHVIDFADALGVVPADVPGDEPYHGSVLYAGDTLGDGNMLRFSGAILLRPPQSNLPGDDPRMMSAFARKEAGPMYGVAPRKLWETYWLAFGAVPAEGENDPDFLRGLIPPEVARINGNSSVWSPRPRGLEPYAHSTGSQQDFGATKGLEALNYGPTFLTLYMYSLTGEALRPMHYREANGLPLELNLHPEWVSWEQRTHWHKDESKDRLGKPHPEPRFNQHGWTSKDDQHMSSHLLHATYALTGLPGLEAIIHDEGTCAFANIRITKDDQGGGAARSLGRVLLMLSNADLLSMESGYLWAIEKWVILWGEKWFGKPYTHPNQTFRPLKITDSDPPQWKGEVEACAIWQESLAALGLAAARRRLIAGGSSSDIVQTCEMLLYEATRNVVVHGFHEESGQWRCASYLRWPSPDGYGLPIPRKYYANGGTRLYVDFGSFLHWSVGIVWYVQQNPHGIVWPADIVAKANQIALPVPWDDVRKREWWATV